LSYELIREMVYIGGKEFFAQHLDDDLV